MIKKTIGGMLMAVSSLSPAALLSPQDRNPSDADLEALSWLSGHWANEAGDVLQEELWMEPKGGLMLGLHRDVALRKNRAQFEYLRIEQQQDGIYYLASPQGRKATPFQLIEQQGEKAVFENPDHDFPQRISYWLEENTLHAKIETLDGQGAVEFQWHPKR